MINTIVWEKNKVRIINQVKLPLKLEFINLDDLHELWKAIRSLKVRGAPALGAAAALGVYLGVKDLKTVSWKKFHSRLKKVIRYIGSSRPTARNLFWGLERVYQTACANKTKPVSRLKQLILLEAKHILEEDKASCRKMGSFGEKLLKDGATVMTICNAGALATVDYGTALGVIYSAKVKGKRIKVFACETRPLLQGSRLTAWELDQCGVDVTLISDNTAASLMSEKKIDLVITGADRISANGDAANKIGTFNLAILAKYHKIPFYIAAPVSTFDQSISSGSLIPIEMRPADEVRMLLGKKLIASAKARVLNPAFDVTPAVLISGIITECGVIRPVNKKNIRKIIGEYKCG
jgi:methylthioribose-1-phosphate isomerase